MKHTTAEIHACPHKKYILPGAYRTVMRRSTVWPQGSGITKSYRQCSFSFITPTAFLLPLNELLLGLGAAALD
jgi:hypothetical protein